MTVNLIFIALLGMLDPLCSVAVAYLHNTHLHLKLGGSKSVSLLKQYYTPKYLRACHEPVTLARHMRVFLSDDWYSTLGHSGWSWESGLVARTMDWVHELKSGVFEKWNREFFSSSWFGALSNLLNWWELNPLSWVTLSFLKRVRTSSSLTRSRALLDGSEPTLPDQDKDSLNRLEPTTPWLGQTCNSLTKAGTP